MILHEILLLPWPVLDPAQKKKEQYCQSGGGDEVKLVNKVKCLFVTKQQPSSYLIVFVGYIIML
jgi:hypothetical protein